MVPGHQTAVLDVLVHAFDRRYMNCEGRVPELGAQVSVFSTILSSPLFCHETWYCRDAMQPACVKLSTKVSLVSVP